MVAMMQGGRYGHHHHEAGYGDESDDGAVDGRNTSQQWWRQEHAGAWCISMHQLPKNSRAALYGCDEGFTIPAR